MNHIRRSLVLGCAMSLVLGLLLPHAGLAQTAMAIEAEDYAAGGEGVGYHDTTAGDQGNAAGYRHDDVDLSTCGAGCHGYQVGYTAAGEWLRYGVAVPSATRVQIVIRMTTPYRGKRLRVDLDGTTLATETAPLTGSWSTWTDWTIVPDAALTAGDHDLRLNFVTDGINLDQIRFIPQGAPSTPTTNIPPTATPPAIPTPIAPGPPGAGPATPSNSGPWFQVVCTAGQRLADDPIVFPNQPGRSHLHQFFGNTATNATNGSRVLERAGTTCSETGDTAAYWVPALYDAQGGLHTPRRVRAYYYANAADRAALQTFPPDLRLIAGSARATTVQPRGVIEWLCRNRRNQAAGLPLAASDPPRCHDDAYLSVSIRFPDCWDGLHRDMPDHQSHMAYADAHGRCPASHPVKVPKLRLSLTYEDAAFHGGAFTLGAPRGNPMALPPSAMHADFWNIWQPGVLEQYVAGCLQHGRAVRGTACHA